MKKTTIKSGDIVKFEGEVVSVRYSEDGVPETATIVTHDGKAGSVIPVEYLEAISDSKDKSQDVNVNVDTDDWKSFVHDLQNKGLQKTYDDEDDNGTISIEIDGEKLASDEDSIQELMSLLCEQLFGDKTLTKTNKEPKQQEPKYYVISPFDRSHVKIPKLQYSSYDMYSKEESVWKDNPDYQWSKKDLEFEKVPQEYTEKV